MLMGYGSGCAIRKMKAQISVDFIIVISIALIIFLYLFTAADKRSDELYSKTTSLYARSVSDQLASNINSVYLAGYGFKKTVLLQETLKDNSNYNINIYPVEHLIKISWNNRQYSSPVLTSSISGTLSSLKGEYEIANIDGVITLTAIGEFVCSNNIKEGTEICDGTDLAGQTCISQGFDGGNLACLGDCTGFDTSSCYTISCQEFYATAFEQSGATNPINVQGAPNNLYAILPTNANWVRGTGFSTATGTITSVEMAMDYHRVGTYANDMIRLRYLIGAAAGATTQNYYDASSDITVYKDVTADRAWAWSDITNMKVEASFRKSGAVDNLDWYVDGLWVRVCHT